MQWRWRNSNRNAIYAYRGNIEIISNTINNTRKHGIKLIEPNKCIINSNKINNTSKNGIHIIEPNNVEITDNTISSNEKNGISILS